jgi:hypothetical protein
MWDEPGACHVITETNLQNSKEEYFRALTRQCRFPVVAKGEGDLLSKPIRSRMILNINSFSCMNFRYVCKKAPSSPKLPSNK